ncbi:MAG: two-component system, OmpR family, sensor histidine kinase KdpD [Gaiellales bacterium]|nr:two-component system, OmpR family, sensor histidine kinase KdpD [Gaiellales bacterium]
MSPRDSIVAAIRRRLPELDEEAAWRGALAGAGSLFLLLVAVAVLVPLRDHFDTGTLALVLLLPPLVAANGGRLLSLISALISALAFNFLFTRPYYSLRIESDASVSAFVVYVLIAFVLATYVSGFRTASAAATRRARSMELLQMLAVDLIRSDDLRPALRRTLADLTAALGLRGAALRVTVRDEELDERSGADDVATARLQQAMHPADAPTVVSLRGGDGVLTLPISDSGITFGLLGVDTGRRRVEDETFAVLESFCGILGLALGRARLEHEGMLLQALKETDRLRTALLQSVSHDLRTPLTAITAAASALRESVPEHEREALLTGIEHEAERLVRLVANMLDLSRIEAGVLQPRRTVMPVDELLYAAVDDAAAGLGVQIVDIDGAADLPPVSVDETMIRQVLVNLLENARRADPDDALGLYAASDGETLRLSVVDHGHGVPEAERRRIFEPYYRLRPGHDHRAGTGLGLAISRGFVEAHGGRIRVEPTPGGGATFIVELPVGT